MSAINPPVTGLMNETTPSSTTASASSPFVNTPGSNAELGLPGRLDAHHQHQSRRDLSHRSDELYHPPPALPSTFLPSYYPESRFPSNSLPSGLMALDVPDDGKHTPSAWERASRTGPSPYDLLDGITLPPPLPTGRQGLGSIGGNDEQTHGSMPSFPRDPSESSAAGKAQHPHWQINSESGPSRTSPGERRFDAEQSPPFPHGPIPDGTEYNPFAQQHNRSNSDGIPNIMLPPPQPSLSQLAASSYTHHPSSHTIRPSQSYVDADGGPLPEFVQTSSIYPPGMYGTNLLVDGQVPSLAAGRAGPEDMSHLYTIYSDLLQGISHIVPSSQPAPPTTSASGGQIPTFASLLSLSTEGMGLLSGQKEQSSPERAKGASARSLAHRLPSTKCLGCGATETPEWRRGPLGPRTLCNACGLVHMKLQRKKRKQEEKAKAAAAASTSASA